jgi:hypothetical protein
MSERDRFDDENPDDDCTCATRQWADDLEYLLLGAGILARLTGFNRGAPPRNPWWRM